MHALIEQGILYPALGILVLAGFTQGLAGFGLALLGVPLLQVFGIAPTISVPLVTMLTVPVSGHMVQQLRAHIDWRRALWLGVPTVLLAPAGVYLLKVLSEASLCLGIGVVLIGSALYSWIRSMQTRRVLAALEAAELAAAPTTVAEAQAAVAAAEWAPATDATNATNATDAAAERAARVEPSHAPGKLVAIGAASGVLGGAIGMNGPLIADYLNKSGIQPSAFKVTLNLIFFASAVTRIGLYFGQGVMQPASLWLALCGAPVAVAASYCGGRLTKRMNPQTFAKVINVFLVLIGLWMLFEAWRLGRTKV